MKKLFTSLSLLGFMAASASAQTFLGLRASPYGGVYNVDYNPAIADNRLEFDINLFGTGVSAQNNYLRVASNKWLMRFNDSTNVYKSEEMMRPGNKFASVQSQTLLPFSFMTSWSGEKGNKNALAFTWHQNNLVNVDNVEERFARILYNGVNAQTDSMLNGIINNPSLDPRLTVKFASWIDYGITYSRVVIDNDKHMLKVGGTLKLIQGQMGGYANVRDFEYSFPNYDSINVKAELDYYHSPNVPTAITSLYSNNAPDNNEAFYKDLFSFKNARPGFAVDLGVVYEWRPKKMDYQYEMDCQKWWRYDLNRYKLSAGVSVIDIGAIPFRKGQRNGRYNLDVQNAALSSFDNLTTLQAVTDTLQMLSTLDSTSRRNFTMWLPTRFNMFVDYNIWKGFGINLMANISPAFTPNQVHYPSVVALTAKYDHPWVGVYVPVSYEFTGNFRVGTTLRLGPVTLGTNNLLSLFGKKASNADFHFGVRLPIPYGRLKDRDKDGVSNKLDLCKKEKGNCKSQGCPDRDGDGVVDAEDECPDNPGPKEYKGCPDSDGDKVLDKDDKCPEVAGLIEFNGCPDRDGDKIPDHEDRCPDHPGEASLQGCPDTDFDGIADPDDDCPDVKGIAEFNGCPDTDGDGIPDKLDACPNLAGPKEYNGCPDTDGDGIFDHEDACPTIKGIPELKGCPYSDADGDGIKDTEDKCPDQPGPIENGGCPYADTDGDGIIDLEDKCPKTPGVKENFGCPPIDEKAKEVLKRAFDNLEFNTGKSTIRSSSFESLNDLATYLKENPQYNLLIEGHTDNVGSRSSNLTLSKNRANAVKTYLAGKGVSTARCITKWYGPDKPVADNSTDEGRQRNRRVEMNLVIKE